MMEDNNMKKIYLFYLCDKKDKITTQIYPAIEDLTVIEGDIYHHVLYAWTPNKNIRKQFKQSRDMTKFKEIIYEISKEDFNKFADDNSDTFLEERPITTKSTTEDKIITKRNIYVLSTRKELDVLVYNPLIIMQKQLECLALPDIYIREEYFNDKYRNMLEFFQLNDIMAYAYPMEESDSLPFNLICDDTLSIYTHLYHNTYRKDIYKI